MFGTFAALCDQRNEILRANMLAFRFCFFIPILLSLYTFILITHIFRGKIYLILIIIYIQILYVNVNFGPNAFISKSRLKHTHKQTQPKPNQNKPNKEFLSRSTGEIIEAKSPSTGILM